MEKKETLIHKQPFFYNWLEDDIRVRQKLTWPYETILEDVVEKNAWLESWGPQPESDQDKIKSFTAIFNKAPKLIPLTSHRFSVSGLTPNDRPILSMIGLDTVLVGWSFRHYLLTELIGS